LAGRRPISGAVRDLVARGDTVFFAEGRTGIRAVDLRHPEPPPTAGMYRFPQPERGLAARDTWLYTATRHGLAVYDARDPADPREVATYEGAGLAVSMVVEGDHAWLLYRNGPDPEEHVRHGVWVVDIADPMHPLEVASLPVSTEVWTIALSGTRAYLATGTGLRIFDATDPTRPREVGAYRFRGEVMALAAGGSHVFVVHDLNAPQTFEVLDVADPAAPRSVFATGKLGGIDLRGRERSVQVQSILVRRSRVLLGVRGIGLVVLDATDPSRPIFEATYETSEPEVASLTADARYVYLATQFHEDLSPVLRVIDLDRGPEPRLVWQTTGVTHLVSSAGFGYGATASGGLAVLRFLGEPRAFLPLALGDASMQADPHP